MKKLVNGFILALAAVLIVLPFVSHILASLGGNSLEYERLIVQLIFVFACLMGSLFSERPPQPPATTEVSAVVGRHPELATAVRQNRGLLETFGSRSLSEVELDYICLHLCAALERRRSVEGQIRVIVACSGGVGMSQLLAETLRGKFDFEIVDVKIG